MLIATRINLFATQLVCKNKNISQHVTVEYQMFLAKLSLQPRVFQVCKQFIVKEIFLQAGDSLLFTVEHH